MSRSDLSQWATWSEIHAQPAIWRDWGRTFDPIEIQDWIKGLDVDEIWLTGAGSSAYIGDMIAAGLEGGRIRAVASTDLVARPHAYLNGRKPLVVSFGRSGNSAESIGVLDALDALAPDAPRLNITCNNTSVLATRKGAGEQRVITLPDATHDAGFAMTSSLTTMLFTALGVLDPVQDYAGRLDTLCATLETLLPLYTAHCGPVPERVVYVGSGPMTYAAREAALKVMELSAGQIPALWDSSLGFRHGPKSFVQGNTAITVFLSPNQHTARYDSDLVDELRTQFPNARITAVGPGGDIDIPMPFGAIWSAPLAIALAQIESVIWSAELGLNVDNPFHGQGTLTRVVSGVTLYEVAS